jgi:hypothetical protein
VGFVVDEMALRQVFPCQFHSTGAPLHGKTKKKKLIIFITGLHNKPQGCGASVASAAGPFTTKKMYVLKGDVKHSKIVELYCIII